MNPTNHSSCLSYNSTLTLMRLFPLPSGSISMHQRAEPANTLCTLFYGLSLSSAFDRTIQISISLMPQGYGRRREQSTLIPMLFAIPSLFICLMEKGGQPWVWKTNHRVYNSAAEQHNFHCQSSIQKGMLKICMADNSPVCCEQKNKHHKANDCTGRNKIIDNHCTYCKQEIKRRPHFLFQNFCQEIKLEGHLDSAHYIYIKKI